MRGITGSNNRLDQQPAAASASASTTAGTLGNFNFNFNFVPATAVQQTETPAPPENRAPPVRRLFILASGAVRDGVNWRLSFANLLPQDAESRSEGMSTSSVTGHEVLTESWSRNKTFRVVSLRADMRFGGR